MRDLAFERSIAPTGCYCLPMGSQAAAGWYHDPSRRHDLRFWDGARWTEHVVTRHIQSVDPLASAPPQTTSSPVDVATANHEIARALSTDSAPPDLGRARGGIGRQVRKAKVGESKWAGGGTLLSEPVLVVNQTPKLFERRAEYTVYNGHGQQLGTVRQLGRNLLKEWISLRSDDQHERELQVVDNQGRILFQLARPQKWLKSKILVARGDGRPIGQITQKSLGIIGGVRFDLEADGQVIGQIKGQGGWDFEFSITDAAGFEVARVSRTWAGMTKERWTKADNYVVQIHKLLEGPLLALVVASALALDTALRQGEIDKDRMKSERWHKFGW